MNRHSSYVRAPGPSLKPKVPAGIGADVAVSGKGPNRFGYLDAVRKAFSDAPEKHTDLGPEDLGLGPYDTAYKAGPR